MTSGPPDAAVLVPAAVRRLAGGRPIQPVWRNETGGLTFRIGSTSLNSTYLKWSPVGGIDLEIEAERLRWAGRYTAVPQVLGTGRDADGNWLETAALPGENAVTPRWVADPARAVRAIGSGLRRLHDTLPVPDCPFSWSVPLRLAEIRSGAGRATIMNWRPGHRRWTAAEALAELDQPPPVEKLVVCHADACSPNTLIDDSGHCCGHVDLGRLGVADRWADLAIATWSTQWNYGPGWEDALLDAYGCAPDPDRTHYYRLLWDFGP